MTDLYLEITAILVLAAVTGLLGTLLKQPLIIAYIIVGVVVGPAVLGWIQARDQVDLLAQLGITLLLFVVGLRLDIHIIRGVGPVALATGLGQILFTSLLGYLIALALGMPPLTALYVAVALTFSSTIIIVKLLSDKREVDTLHGRIALGFLIVQDIVVILAMIGLSSISETGTTPELGREAAGILLKGGSFIAAVVLLTRFVLTPWMHRVAKSQESLLLFAITWAVTLSVISIHLGFNKEVGAFLAGVALASTPYREAIGARLGGLRDFLLLFFFIDLGARLELSGLAGQLVPVGVLSLFVLVGNPIIVMAIMGAMGYRKRTGFLAGLTVAQISEFSLILGALGVTLGHIDDDTMSLITLVGLVTICASTYLILYSHELFERLAPWLDIFERRLPQGWEPDTLIQESTDTDAIVFGLGRYGARIAQGLHARSWRVLGMDFDPDLVRERKQAGQTVCYGDAEDPEMLSHLPLARVRWVISTIRDLNVNRSLLQSLNHLGFRGQVAIAANREEEAALLESLGVNLVLLPYHDAADRVVDLVTGPEQHRITSLGDDQSVFAQSRPWHSAPPEQVLQQLQVDPAQGLSEQEARSRRQRHGANQLMEKPPTPLWRLLLRQFKSLLILILIGAAGLSWAIGDLMDALIILLVVGINALLGFHQEYRAEQSLAMLKKMLVPEAEVRRDGKERMIPATDLVPGDIVILDAGDRVPADGRLIQAHNLHVDESSLTGESHPVTKIADPLPEALPLADRRNMLYMNTSVTRGRAEIVVTATGMTTEIGRLAAMLATTEEAKTPLQIQLDSLGRQLAAIAGLVVILMLVGGWLRAQPWSEMLFTAIALAVASIPEGLPAVVTVTLALGLHRMARQRAIVKRLAAVETLGCTTVICSDKTGTMTLNQMTARTLYCLGRSWHVSGHGYSSKGKIEPDHGEPADLTDAILPFVLCNDARLTDDRIVGDPMEGALLVLATKAGMDPEELKQNWPRIAEIPFDTAHKFMATFHHRDNKVIMLVKGAPEVVLKRSTNVLEAEGIRPLEQIRRRQWLEINERLASTGLRILAAAQREIPAAEFDPEADDLLPYAKDLTLLGLVGLMDPPRPEAREAIRLCQRAGIQVKMITGDQPVTAMAISRELGLRGKLITGPEMERLSDVSLQECIDSTTVFARTTPDQKVRIVKALQAQDHVVAMTGDGVNDAPALKTADIGVAMGISGTDVAKEAATMILTDDNFATIVSAVREGRTIYDNILKFVRFQLSTNIGAILTLLSAPFFGLPLPLNPIQILWINIIMDGPPAMALGVDPPRPGIMDEPPRSPRAQILLPGRLLGLVFFGCIMMSGTLLILCWGMETRDSATALSLAFTAFVWFQIFNVFNARAEKNTAFNYHSLRNRWLWISITGVAAMQWLALMTPVGRQIFHTAPLTPEEWGLAIAVASSILVLEEIRKALLWGLQKFKPTL